MLDHLSIAGATLAALLQSCCSYNRPCVGLLFGRVTTAISKQAQDTADDVVVQEVVGHITSSITCVGTHCFYDNAGDIAEEKLAVLLSGGCSSSSRQLLGWFSYRPDTPNIPSMLEAAVCHKLQAVLASSNSGDPLTQQQQQPLVFGLITSQREHSGATVSLQHRFFTFHRDNTWLLLQQQQHRPSSTLTSSSGGSNRGLAQQHPNLQALDLQVLNLGQQDMRQPATAAAAASGSNAGAAKYSSSNSGSQGLQQLSVLAAVLQGSAAAVGSSAAAGSMQQQLLAAAKQVDAPGGQLSVVEGVYGSLLDELQLAAAAVTQQQDQLMALQQENEALRQQLLDARLAGNGSSSSTHKGPHPHAVELL